MENQHDPHKKAGRGMNLSLGGQIDSTTHVSLNKYKQLIRKIQYRLCRLLCKHQMFNRDMSLEIDRLTVEIDELRKASNER